MLRPGLTASTRKHPQAQSEEVSASRSASSCLACAKGSKGSTGCPRCGLALRSRALDSSLGLLHIFGEASDYGLICSCSEVFRALHPEPSPCYLQPLSLLLCWPDAPLVSHAASKTLGVPLPLRLEPNLCFQSKWRTASPWAKFVSLTPQKDAGLVHQEHLSVLRPGGR